MAKILIWSTSLPPFVASCHWQPLDVQTWCCGDIEINQHESCGFEFDNVWQEYKCLYGKVRKWKFVWKSDIYIWGRPTSWTSCLPWWQFQDVQTFISLPSWSWATHENSLWVTSEIDIFWLKYKYVLNCYQLQIVLVVLCTTQQCVVKWSSRKFKEITKFRTLENSTKHDAEGRLWDRVEGLPQGAAAAEQRSACLSWQANPISSPLLALLGVNCDFFQENCGGVWEVQGPGLELPSSWLQGQCQWWPVTAFYMPTVSCWKCSLIPMCLPPPTPFPNCCSA